MLLQFAACTPPEPVPTETPQPTSTPEPTLTPTATIVWFPPTNTPTQPAVAGPSPTLFPLPELGQLLLEDDFDDPGVWALSQTTSGGSALGVDELTIVVNTPGAYVSTTRMDAYLDDYFLEVTAATSLCAGEDEYGLLLRAASPSDFYRFSLSCDGRLRLDQIRGGTASAPLPWTLSAAVPRNAPATVRLGIWADGDAIHIFIDGAYQVSAQAAVFDGGTIGFFARSAGNNAVTVNFRELRVWQIGP
ncbi:MAG TPA: hypothetical protein VMN57_14250 [Anaerolineales bacterium]|nr:hypothetical protein [Anaerolineales bacterium]